MQSNWSLILNVLLLVSVIIAIGRIMKIRRRNLSPEIFQPTANEVNASIFDASAHGDDIISVRKVSDAGPQLWDEDSQTATVTKEQKDVHTETESEEKAGNSTSLMIFLVAKESRHFAGYELLQTILAAGLRFGEDNLFYRHQFSNGQGPVFCGLAAATPTGVFDMQNIGAFSVRGLCLFMHIAHNPGIDSERFTVMLETAKQLAEGLDATLLDDKRQPLTKEVIARYNKILNAQ